MPFGVSSAPENFQRQMSKILAGLEGTLCHMDDILVFGKDEEEHDRRLIEVLERLRKSGMTLNKEKCTFRTKSVEFLGHTVNERGIKASDDKINAILNMNPPTTPKEMKRLLGMVDYMRKFNPSLAEIEVPLRKLIKKNSAWYWGPEQEQAFTELKRILTSSPTLVKFDIRCSHRVTADASQHSIGAALLQKENNDWYPVSYASRTMTETKKRYAQIEKEALAVTWACQKLDFFLVGRKFEIETDHKPLIPLLGEKDLSQLPLRIQRFKLRLMRYTFSIYHSPGSLMFIADNLSRVSYPTFREQERDKKVEAHIRCVISSKLRDDRDINNIRIATAKDPLMMEITRYCQSQWPDKLLLSHQCRQYEKVKDDITFYEGILLKGDRIIIPYSLRGDILKQIHEGHQGIVKCLRRTRDSVWWPGVNREVEDMVKECETCIKHHSIQHQPMTNTF